MKIFRSLVSSLIFIINSSVTTLSQGSAEAEKAKDAVGISGKSLIREMGIDMSVPESPAFAALGLTPETVIRPTTPRNLVTSVLSGNDPKGNDQKGLAVDFNPYLLFAGNSLTINDYRQNPEGFNPNRQASRVSFSLAVARGSGDDDADRAAVGLTYTPWDLGDPRNDEKLLNCMIDRGKVVHDKAVAKAHTLAPIFAMGLEEDEERAQINEALKPFKEEIRPIHEKCRKEAAKRNWNASAWNIGFAPTWIDRPNESGDFEWSGATFWTTLSYGFENFVGLEDTSQILAHVKFRSDEELPHPTLSGNFVEQDRLIAAFQIRLIGPTFQTGGVTKVGGPDVNFSFEGAYVREEREMLQDETTFRYSLGAEYKIQKDLYFKISAGTETGRNTGGNESFVLGNIKWAFNAEPTK